MKLGDIVRNEKVISKLSTIDIPGAIAYKLMDSILTYEEELNKWNKLRQGYIQKNGDDTKDGGKEIATEEGKKKFLEWAEEVLNTEISVKPPVQLTDEHLSSVKLSIMDIKGLKDLQLIA